MWRGSSTCRCEMPEMQIPGTGIKNKGGNRETPTCGGEECFGKLDRRIRAAFRKGVEEYVSGESRAGRDSGNRGEKRLALFARLEVDELIY
jgi:hypothetical protein